MLRNTDPAASHSPCPGPATHRLESHWVTAGAPLPHMVVVGEGSGGWHPVRRCARQVKGGGAGARVSGGYEAQLCLQSCQPPRPQSCPLRRAPRRAGVEGRVGDQGWRGVRPMMTRMRRADVLQIIAEHAGELRELGVRSLSLFGSVARDQAAPGSDVDLLVDFDPPVGYFHLFEVQDRLEGFPGLQGRPGHAGRPWTGGSPADPFRGGPCRIGTGGFSSPTSWPQWGG